MSKVAIADTCASVSGKYATGQSNGWKTITKDPWLASTMTVEGQVGCALSTLGVLLTAK